MFYVTYVYNVYIRVYQFFSTRFLWMGLTKKNNFPRVFGELLEQQRIFKNWSSSSSLGKYPLLYFCLKGIFSIDPNIDTLAATFKNSMDAGIHIIFRTGDGNIQNCYYYILRRVYKQNGKLTATLDMV